MDTLVLFGTEVKAYDDGRVDGYLVQFGEPDASKMRDVFTKVDTDFDIDPVRDTSTMLYHHGLDPVLKRKRLGKEKAEIGVNDVGVWIKGQLDLRNEYEAAIHQLAKAGKLGWSSGVPGHLVERKAIGDDAHLVTSWPLGKDASLTPIPADPRNMAGVGSIKSIADIESMSLEDAIKSLLMQPEAQTPETSHEVVGAANEGAHAKTKTNPLEVHEMSEQTPQPEFQAEDNAMKAELAAIKSQNDKFQSEFSTKIDNVLKHFEESPWARKGGYYSGDGGTADPNIKSLEDMLLAIKRNDVKRLAGVYNLKAQSESDGTLGGWFVPEQTLTDLLGLVSLTSGVGNLINRVPVQSPTGRSIIRDYSRTPGGSGESASSAGVSGQMRSEAGSYGPEDHYFEFLRYEVTDFCSGSLKASYELVQDAPQIKSYLQEAIREDVANKEEYAILRGSGVAVPLGILNWTGKIEVTEVTDNTFAAADMDAMVSKLMIFDRSRVAWVYFNYVYTQVAALERGSQGAAAYHNIRDALPGVLSGYPQFMSQHLPNVGTDGYIILGDWSRYFMFELGGLYIRYSEQRYIDTGQVAWFFGKRIDGRPALTSSVKLADGSNTISPFVVIKNKT